MKFVIITLRMFFLFSLIAFFISCKEQFSTKINPESITEANSTTTKGQEKIIKAENAKYNNIHCAILDKDGNIWFGTTGQGIYRYDGKTFTHFTEKDGLVTNSVNAILLDNTGNIWFGTNAGISRYNGKKFTNISLGFTNGNYLSTYKSLKEQRKNPPPKNAVWSMLQDKTGKIWIGTYNDGVYCYDGKSFTHFLHQDSVINTSKIQLNAVNSIIEDKAGNIWFATWFEGLCQYDGKQLTSFKPNGEVWYSSLLNDKNGHIWIGRRTKGVMVYDGKSFTNIEQGGTLDSCGGIPLLQDKEGNIWFGSVHSNMSLRETLGGLWRYDGKTFTNFTTKNGLINNSIWSAVEDKTGNIWFGATNIDLFRYEGNKFTSFTE